MTTATTPTASAPPKFTRGGAMLATPMPPSLARAIPAAARKKHEQIGERLAESSRPLADLRRQLAEAPTTDAEAAAAAVAAGEEIPPSSEERLRGELAEAHRVHEAIERGLRKSADGLLAEALGHADKVADRLDGERRAAVDDLRGDLAALEQRLGALAALSSELAWARALSFSSGATVSPFQASPVFKQTAEHLSVAGQAFEHELAAFDEGLRQARAWAEHNAGFAADEAAERERRTAARAEREPSPPSP